MADGRSSSAAAFLPAARGNAVSPEERAQAAVQAIGKRPIGLPLIPRQSEAFERPVVLMIALGMEGDMLDKLIAQARPLAPSEPEPLFLIDHVDFSSLTQDGVLFEHFPSSTSKALLDGDLPWTRYAERRLDLLVAKWRPVSIVPFGKRSLDLLSSWRDRQQR